MIDWVTMEVKIVLMLSPFIDSTCEASGSREQGSWAHGFWGWRGRAGGKARYLSPKGDIVFESEKVEDRVQDGDGSSHSEQPRVALQENA